MPIRLLDDATAARIAAGEVIERPASVVKELIENALDAGATRIDIEVESTGSNLIRVVDDGCGIDPDQLQLAFQRFATSKVDETSDLLGIKTLGFRGEALPSIASVSRIETSTRTPDHDSGERLVLEFGVPVESGKIGVPIGTAVTVEDLFSNVPARKKFMRSPGAEMGRIQSLVTSYALVRSDVAFRLTGNGRHRVSTPGGKDLRGAVAGVYGTQIADAMLHIPESGSYSGGGTQAFSVGGLAGTPSVSRGNRGYITIGINGRWIQSRRITFAIQQAYHGMLKERRFPIVLALISTPINDVDVNVHPAKTEVRFLREDLVFSEVQRAVRGVLVGNAPVPGFRPSSISPVFTGTKSKIYSRSSPPVVPLETDIAQNPLWPSRSEDESVRVDSPSFTNLEVSDNVATGQGVSGNRTQRETLPVLRMIGQTHETYLLAEGPDGVYMIDQHAAHERVRFEEITSALETGTPDAQQILEPESLTLEPRQEELLNLQADVISGIGFVLEPFGPSTVLIRAIPRMLADRTSAAAEALRNLLDEVASGGRHDAWRDRMIATLACHSSVRAGMKISDEEGRALLRSLEHATQPHTCPHGRPTMIHMSNFDLERGFGRR